MKLANCFLLLISFNLISVERDQLDVDFLSDDEYRIDLIFIKSFELAQTDYSRNFIASHVIAWMHKNELRR